MVERKGRIFIIPDNNPSAAAELFLDIGNLIDTSASEKGLLGLAFAPDYSTSGFFYINNTDRQGTVIARYSRQAQNHRAADPASRQILLEFAQPYPNHNGGHLSFGPDEYLYIATGDGGSSGDPGNNAQTPGNLPGKILRIDVNPALGQGYAIPADNPFAGD